jgi:NAD(P)-dependent dehydrogenase (short-subunit alcohol dehydrogenase family)
MQHKYFRGGTAGVTGAGSGLGASMVRRFTAEDMAIVALDIDAARAMHSSNYLWRIHDREFQ